MSENYNYSEDESESDSDYSQKSKKKEYYDDDESEEIEKEYKEVIASSENENMFQCTICEKFYGNDMLCNNDKNLKCCLHCHFWMNYDTFKKMAPSKFSDDKPNPKDDTELLVIKDVCDYVSKCAPGHNPALCPRKDDSCFMCDYKDGLFTLEIPKITKAEPKPVKSIKKFNYNSNGMQLKIPKHFSI